MLDSSAESLLLKGLKELSLPCTAEQVGLFLTYLAELKKWNRAYNLTSLRSDEEIVVKHFLDSLLYLTALPDGSVRVIDVGSGAGFPGIPMKIMRPGLLMYLLEPSRKKATFLRHIVGALGLERTEIIEKRAEDLKSLTVDAAVTRALFSVKDLWKKTRSIVREGGLLILSKGPKVSEELKEAEAAGLACELVPLLLPLAGIKRFLVVVRKSDPAQIELEGVGHSGAARPYATKGACICVNAECRLRMKGCKGFEGCPGFKGRG